MATFLEGVEGIGAACTLVVLVPAVALVLVARNARLMVAVCYVVGAVVLVWARVVGYWDIGLSGLVMPLAAALVVGAYVFAYRSTGPDSPSATGAGMVAGALAGWLWQPCVGPELGDILNNAATESVRSGALLLVYAAGALLPALLLALTPHALPKAKQILDRLPVVVLGAAVGVVYAATLAVGRYNDLIGELHRIIIRV
ncbi:MAG: hypothetical protein OXI96_06000 [Acidimicrobiaceae bacterium]|nr:hypothetical protein [Acidimicrobiaceae bacterium]